MKKKEPQTKEEPTEVEIKTTDEKLVKETPEDYNGGHNHIANRYKSNENGKEKEKSQDEKGA